MSGGAGPSTIAGHAAVDVPTARELLEAVHRRISRDEIAAIVRGLQDKARLFADRLGEDAIGRADEAVLREVLGCVFVARRKASAVLGARPASDLRDVIAALLYGDGAAGERLDAFCAQIELPQACAAELGGELLHFTQPERHWLCSRFVYNAGTRTGALPLLVSEDYELDADTVADSYERIGVAIGALDGSAETSSFRVGGGGPLATDLFLACVYGVYMNTVLGLKMSQEFNALIPPLPQLARRLLGTQRMVPTTGGA
ncbi:MAG: hypothetical protein ACLGI5_03970 [Thermoleophilia bacterium]